MSDGRDPMRTQRDLGTRRRRTVIEEKGDGRSLAEAKVIARSLLTEFAHIDCSLAVMGTALAILLGAVAVQIRSELKENFYEDFLLAARESETEWERAYASYAKMH